MCGRFVYYGQPSLFQERFAVADEPPPFEPAYNITAGYVLPVIARSSPNRAVFMKWGLVPFWAKELSIGYKMINARAEGIEAKPAFRKPIRSQRCLVPANGFYEWQQVSEPGKAPKQPYFIHLQDREVFAFAGIYDVWRDPEGQELRTFAIVTTQPNEFTARIHNRMPVILAPEEEDAWLDGSTRLDHVLALLRPYPAAAMAAHPVAKLVNNPRANGPELLAPLTELSQGNPTLF
jgi:putative SOS response-associated peptidase YedK